MVASCYYYRFGIWVYDKWVVVVEVIFAWPGLGRTIFDAIANRDIPLVQAAVVVISVFVIIINLITDLVYAKLDPRIKL